MRLRVAILLAVASVAVNCSSDSVVDPGHRSSDVAYTLQLTSVSGTPVPAVYFVDTSSDHNDWADSATVTVQPDGVVAFRIYAAEEAPISEAHANLRDQFYFASGKLISDSTFEIDYLNAAPDHGTINRDGSVTVDLTGVDESGTRHSFGRWVFATRYGGHAFNPAPHIDSVTPSSVSALSGDTTILISGSSFMSTSRVSIDDSSLSVSYVNFGQLRVAMPAWAVHDAGTLELLVTNPGPGGGTYYAPLFVHRTVPTITALSPISVRAGSPYVIIDLTGTGFDSASYLTFNGVQYGGVRYLSSTSLSIPVDGPDISAARIISIAVVNPPPGGGTSNALVFTVTSQ